MNPDLLRTKNLNQKKELNYKVKELNSSIFHEQNIKMLVNVSSRKTSDKTITYQQISTKKENCMWYICNEDFCCVHVTHGYMKNVMNSLNNIKKCLYPTKANCSLRLIHKNNYWFYSFVK